MPSRPFSLIKDGELVGLVRRLICCKCARVTRVSLVKGHADEDMVRRGQVCELDRIGNDVVDEAADFGRWRVHCSVILC